MSEYRKKMVIIKQMAGEFKEALFNNRSKVMP